MIPSLVPTYIVDFHRALLEALRVDYFAPGMIEMNGWRDFLFVMQPLADSAGGPFTKRDLAAAVALMRHQNRANCANWALRFAKIMRDPESFRDLVMLARKQVRSRPAVETVSTTQTLSPSTSVTRLTERDPAAEAEPTHISRPLREWRERMRRNPPPPSPDPLSP